MDIKPFLSIIIPVYNGETYLPVCLESVLNQTAQSIEIIIVNDGSTDKTVQIVQDYAEQDRRIVVMNKENGGVSSARNMGLGVANGTYTWFVDADDWLDFTAVEILQGVAGKREYDTIIFSYSLVKHSGGIDSSPASVFPNGYEFNKDSEEVFDNLLSGNLGNVWRCIYKTTSIQNRLFFDENLRNAEDILFTFQFLTACQKGTYLDKRLYFYRKTPNSLTHSFRADQYANSRQVRALLYKEIEQIWPDKIEFRNMRARRYPCHTLKYIMRLFQEYKDYDAKDRYTILLYILDDDLFQDLASRVNYQDFGVIFRINLWLASRKMARTIWVFNTFINSKLGRAINKVLGVKLI